MIAHGSASRYDLHTMVDTPAALERRLDAGEWLRPGEVAVLLGWSRSTVTNRINDGTIAHRWKGKQRVCKPQDVRRLLDKSREEHRGAGG
jgi:Helix-turn-helix domain